MELILVGGVLGLLGVIGIVVSPALKIAPYAYGSARVRAAKGKILTDEELQGYAQQTYKDVTYQLEKRGVCDLHSLMDAEFREEKVQQQLRNSYMETVRRMISYVPGGEKAFFRVLHSREEEEFIVSVLRSKVNVYHDRHLFTELFVQGETFSAAELPDLEKMSLQDFITRLKKTPYNDLISEHAEDIKKGDLEGVERAFNELYFSRLRKAAGNNTQLRSYARIRIDIHNIRTALSLQGLPTYIDGGSLGEDILSSMGGAKTLKDVCSALEGTRYADHLKDCSSVQGAVRGLMRFRKAYAQTLSLLEPLGINQILSYYILKMIELRNVQIILKLQHARFDSRRISEALI